MNCSFPTYPDCLRPGPHILSAQKIATLSLQKPLWMAFSFSSLWYSLVKTTVQLSITHNMLPCPGTQQHQLPAGCSNSLWTNLLIAGLVLHPSHSGFSQVPQTSFPMRQIIELRSQNSALQRSLVILHVFQSRCLWTAKTIKIKTKTKHNKWMKAKHTVGCPSGVSSLILWPC